MIIAIAMTISVLIVTVDEIFKIVRDRFDDFIGVLIIGREIKELKRFREIYSISKRESNVINLIVAGNSNRMIADELIISEQTVKTHVKNIYNKLGVNNKIQLLEILKDFKLISEQSAHKTLVLLK